MTVKDFLMFSYVSKFSKSVRRLWVDTKGAVLIYITATLPVLVGFSLLAIDASRMMTLHTSLQKGVDALAIAAAGELDRQPDAMDSAEKAVEVLLNNVQVFGNENAAIDHNNVTLTFYSDLPANDWEPMPTSGNTVMDRNNADDDLKARFVQVEVDTYSMDAIFPASFLGGNDGGTVRTSAVAGNDSVVCKLMPLFICNPWESSTNTDIFRTDEIRDALRTRANRRKMIRMRLGPGPNSDYFPGNFGYLQEQGPGATELKKALAYGNPGSCFLKDGVETKTGQTVGPVEDGINVRFGLYGGGTNNLAPNGASPNQYWQTRPARNVRMGQTLNECVNYTPQAANMGMPLPRDKCVKDQNCAQGWLGDGEWGSKEMDEYWEANHPPYTPTGTPGDSSVAGYDECTDPYYDQLDAEAAPGDVAPAIDANSVPEYAEFQYEAAATCWNQVTRYDIYQYEIKTDQLVSGSPTTKFKNVAGKGGEIGDPTDPSGSQCWQGSSLATDTIDRRLINGAVLNCNALEAEDPPRNLGGHEVGLPVAAFLEFFLTEPIEKGGSGTAGDIYTEPVRMLLPGNGGLSTSLDQVQLYR